MTRILAWLAAVYAAAVIYASPSARMARRRARYPFATFTQRSKS